MTIDDIKKFQASNGIAIELADSLSLSIIAGSLRKAMSMSVEYESLCRKVKAFTESEEIKGVSTPGIW